MNDLRVSRTREKRNLEKHSVHIPADLKLAPGLSENGRRLIANAVVTRLEIQGDKELPSRHSVVVEILFDRSLFQAGFRSHGVGRFT